LVVVAAVGVTLLAQLGAGPVQPHPTPLIIRLDDDGDRMCQGSPSAFMAGIRRVRVSAADEGWRVEIRDDEGALVYRRVKGAAPRTPSPSEGFAAAPQASAKFRAGRYRVMCHGARGGMSESVLTVTGR
jgi:hypothetical protein